MDYINQLLIFLICISFNSSKNIDTNSPLYKSVTSPKNSLFGFSVSIFIDKDTNTKQILVGAPGDDNQNYTGAIFVCPLSNMMSDCVNANVKELSGNALLGYSIDSNSDTGNIYTCAPRFLYSFKNALFVEGKCMEFDKNLSLKESFGNRECQTIFKKYTSTYQFRNCLSGSTISVIGNRHVLATAPYFDEGRGVLGNYLFDKDMNSWSQTFLRFDDNKASFQLTGYSLKVGQIFREANVKTIILGAPGLPQSNLSSSSMGLGQVSFVKLFSNSPQMSYSGSQSGYVFNSGYGYSVLAIDLNNDGYDELLVGAPYINTNKGMVYVYWNSDLNSGSNAFSIPLMLEIPTKLTPVKQSNSGQFGSCLEQIGDINKDSLTDFAVGAPFENDGSGSVYIYLGNKDREIQLSQRIEAKSMSTDLRGFGFSLTGKIIDIDDNGFSDLIVGAAVSGQVLGLRTRPLIRIYANNVSSQSELTVPYDFSGLKRCFWKDDMLPCVELRIAIFYFYPHLSTCPLQSISKNVTWKLNLDKTYLKSVPMKRIHFADTSTSLTGHSTIFCKSPSENSERILSNLTVYFPKTPFFNVSVPIEITLNWSANNSEVPKRDYNGGALVDLIRYPFVDTSSSSLVNKISFGSECNADSCRPILSFSAGLQLTKVNDEYIIYIGTSSKISVKADVKNIGQGKVFYSFLRVDYQSKFLQLSSVSKQHYRTVANGLIYSLKSPLLPKEPESVQFNFTISNDFIESGEKYITIKILLESSVKQPHLREEVFRIRVKMIADIDIKTSVVPDSITFHQSPILGFNEIHNEEDIGRKITMKISLSNKFSESIVAASKLVIYFPWEIAGDVKEEHGQFMLYLLTAPKFSISGQKRAIVCDSKGIKSIENVIKIKFRPSSTDSNEFRDVTLGNITFPEKVDRLSNLSGKLIFKSAEKSDWEKTVIVSCVNGSARCVPIVCDIGPLSKTLGELTFLVSFRVWLYTLIENFINYKFVWIDVPIYWVPEVKYDIVSKNTGQSPHSFVSTTIVAVNLQKPQPKPSSNIIWAVLGATLAGFMVLAFIIVILYKCNFFRRKSFKTLRRKY